MKYLVLLSIYVLSTGCATSPEVAPEVKSYCSKVCAEQGMRLWEAKADLSCECYDRPERRILERQ